ncbi:MAG: hypothetical protein WCO84_04315 [bacterium]
MFDSVSFVDENGDSLADDRSFNSNHQIVFRGPFTIPANTSKTVSILGNMVEDLTDYSGQSPVIQISNIDATTKVSGELPIKGTAQTANDTLVIGGATAMLSSYDPTTSNSRNIGDKGIRFSGIRITANSKEDLTLSSISWNQMGTASEHDLTNVATVINGVSYPTTVDGKYFTSTFPGGILIPKGQVVDVYIQGDLTISGADRTVEFDIKSSGDVWLTGNLYGYGVGIYADGNISTIGNSVFITSDGTSDGDEGTPFFSGSVVTINSGSINSIGRSN